MLLRKYRSPNTEVSKSNRISIWFQLYVLYLILLAFNHVAYTAEQNNTNTTTHTIQLVINQTPKPFIHLEARQAPLRDILKQIADKTGVRIHYSVLPEAPVTATCIGETADQVMDCLVAKQIGLVAHKAQSDSPAEFWLLGSSVGSCQAMVIKPTTLVVETETEQQPTPDEQAQVDEAMQEQSDRFLEQAKATDPNQRAEAISNLISGGVKNDPNVHKVLEDALSDNDASVRAQAINALAKREGADAGEALRQALRDPNADVRLAVVDNADDDVVLLQQALTDKNAMVRDYATTKLKALEKAANRK